MSTCLLALESIERDFILFIFDDTFDLTGSN
jgi:hypothetical protein